jgi:hypothetical protein
MINKLKEIKQFTEKNIVKMQDDYKINVQEFDIGDSVWLAWQDVPQEHTIIGVLDFPINIKGEIGIIKYTIDGIYPFVIAGDDFFRTYEEARTYFMYKTILNCTMELLEIKNT